MKNVSRIRVANGSDELPLPTLLSFLLVAFTIEFDNEFEHRTPHRTTVGRASGPQSGPWLASMAMYSNFLRIVPDTGISVHELQRLARTSRLKLNGMAHWGYIVFAPDPADQRPKPPEKDWLVRLTGKGRLAKDVWASLFSEIETRWRVRFGTGPIDALRDALFSLESNLDFDLPEYLPILGYGLAGEPMDERIEKRSPHEADARNTMTLPALLSKVLLAFAIEFERKSEVSLAICADVLRMLEDQPVRVRDLPRLSGVSKEAIAMSAGFLRARKYAVLEADSGASRGKVLRLTAKGLEARKTYIDLLAEIEERWRTHFGQASIRDLRNSLVRIVDAEDAGQSLLRRGMEPYPDGWRAKIPKPETLPHYPMVLHRGGYPDGS